MNTGRLKMFRKSLLMSFTLLAIVVATEPVPSVHGILMTPDELATITDSEKSSTNTDSKTEKRDNGFVRALKAPFKAIGNLFSRKKSENKRPIRISQNDAKKFETVPTQVVRVNSEAPRLDEVVDRKAAAATHLERGRTFLNSGRLDEAIGELSQAVSLDPSLADGSNLLGVAYESKGLSDLALKSFHVALHAHGDEPQHLNNLGYLLFKQGDYEGAIKHLKKAAKLAPNDARIWNNLGLAQSEKGNFDDAYRSFARVTGEYQGHLNIAIRLEQKGRTRDAINHLEKARKLQPESAEVLSQLARLYQREGRIAEANQAQRTLAEVTSVANGQKPQ